MESTQTNTAKEALKAMMIDEEGLKKAMEVPAQAMDMVIETTKKVQEANLEYFRQIERIQREHWQGISKLMNVTLPGEKAREVILDERVVDGVRAGRRRIAAQPSDVGMQNAFDLGENGLGHLLMDADRPTVCVVRHEARRRTLAGSRASRLFTNRRASGR